MNEKSKYFVVDTNVLLHNPNAIFLFADNEVVIPFDVIEELDTFKASTDDLGRNARAVIRHLDRFREKGNLAKGVDIEETGGRISVVLSHEIKLSPGLVNDTPDNRIISVAYDPNAQGQAGGIHLQGHKTPESKAMLWAFPPRTLKHRKSTLSGFTPAGAKYRSLERRSTNFSSRSRRHWICLI